jgi:hypothetical protein
MSDKQSIKRYLTEIITMVLQVCLFYILPLFAGPTDAMGMVVLMLGGTALLSIANGWISTNKIRFLYCILAALVFIPTIPIYYNWSAAIHIVWYFLVSLIGTILGACMRWLLEWTHKLEEKFKNKKR